MNLQGTSLWHAVVMGLRSYEGLGTLQYLLSHGVLNVESHHLCGTACSSLTSISV